MTTQEDNDYSKKELKYITKGVCCCENTSKLYLNMSEDNVRFIDENNNIFFDIPKNEIIAINKRQINKHDIFKFSIFHQKKGEEKIHELKLKANNKKDTNDWINYLRKKIKPKRYEFNYNKENYVDANEIYKFHDKKNLYITLCHLEYILCRKDMNNFFDFYSKTKNNDDYSNNKNDSFSEDNHLNPGKEKDKPINLDDIGFEEK